MKTHFVKIDQPFINTIVQDVLKIQIFGIAKYLAKKKKKGTNKRTSTRKQVKSQTCLYFHLAKMK